MALTDADRGVVLDVADAMRAGAALASPDLRRALEEAAERLLGVVGQKSR